MPSDTTGNAGPPLPRDQFPAAERCAYLDTAYASPLPTVAVEATAADALDAARRGSASIDDRYARLAGLRSSVADLLAVPHADVALVPNTTRGFGVVAGGLDWEPGDRVVVRADDHSATVVPWRVQAHRGVEVTTVEAVTGAALLDAVARELAQGRVRVVALSWVHASSGVRVALGALAEIAHAHGALLCVDAIQGAGVVPPEVGAGGADVVALGAQKWALGPHGIGAVAVRPEVAERLSVPTASDASLVAPWTGGDPVLAHSARRAEGGAPNLSGAAAWAAGLDLLAAASIPAVWTWVDHLASRIAERCRAAGLVVRSDRSPSARSGIVLIDVPGVDSADAVRRLAGRDVVVSARAGGLRLSPAGWNDETDVDAAVAALVAL